MIRICHANTLDGVIGRLDRRVGHYKQGHAVSRFDLIDTLALFVEQVGRYFHGYISQYTSGVVLHCLFFNQTQDRQCC